MLCRLQFVLVVKSSEGHLHEVRELRKMLADVFLWSEVSHLRSQLICAYYTWFAKGLFRENSSLIHCFETCLSQKPVEFANRGGTMRGELRLAPKDGGGRS